MISFPLIRFGMFHYVHACLMYQAVICYIDVQPICLLLEARIMCQRRKLFLRALVFLFAAVRMLVSPLLYATRLIPIS